MHGSTGTGTSRGDYQAIAQHMVRQMYQTAAPLVPPGTVSRRVRMHEESVMQPQAQQPVVIATTQLPGAGYAIGAPAMVATPENDYNMNFGFGYVPYGHPPDLSALQGPMTPIGDNQLSREMLSRAVEAAQREAAAAAENGTLLEGFGTLGSDRLVMPRAGTEARGTSLGLFGVPEVRAPSDRVMPTLLGQGVSRCEKARRLM